MRNPLSTLRPYFILLLLIVSVLCANSFAAQNKQKEAPENQATTARPHLDSPVDKILAVLRSPRCMNCHPSGDRPRQGDEMKFHNFGVMRGADNQGGPVAPAIVNAWFDLTGERKRALPLLV